MAAARERGEHELDALGLAVHDRLDIREEPIGRSLGALKPFVAPVLIAAALYVSVNYSP